MYTIGKIINTHGIKGEVKVKRITDFSDRFDAGKIVYLLDETEQMIPLVIVSSRVQKEFDLLLFEGYQSISEVEELKGLDLFIKEEQLTDLDTNEYYYHEIIGCKVVTTAGEELGIIDSILSPGANDVWVIKGIKGKEILIPYIEDVVKKVDVNKKHVVIEVMEGLLE